MPYMNVVGESHYPDGQALMCQIDDRGETRQGADGLYTACEVELRAEPDNPYDSNAVAVYIRSLQQGGEWIKAGYLPKDRNSTPQGNLYGQIRRHPDNPDNPGLRITWSGAKQTGPPMPEIRTRTGCLSVLPMAIWTAGRVLLMACSGLLTGRYRHQDGHGGLSEHNPGTDRPAGLWCLSGLLLMA